MNADEPVGSWRSRRRLAVAMAVLGILGLAGGSWLAVSQGRGSASASGPAARPSAAARPGKGAHPAPPAATPSGITQVAIVLDNSPRFTSPDHRAAGTVPSTWESRPSILPVIATRPGWVQVRLPQRPNGSTAWLPSDDVALNVTPYRIVVNLTTRLTRYNQGKVVLSTPAGIGTATDPTPPGHYFLAFDESPPQPNPGYGPFIMVTSAHSPSITDWEGSGDAVIGIHGPLGADAAIGATGAMVSHGCIRLHEAAQLQLRPVPPGTPIDIIG